MVFGVFIGYKRDILDIKSKIRAIPFQECYSNGKKKIETLFSKTIHL